MDQKIPKEKGEQALEELDRAIKSLKQVNQSDVIHLNFSDKISMLDSERDRIKDRMDGSGKFFEEEAEKAVQEYSDMRGISIEAGARNAASDLSELVQVYKGHVNSSDEEDLPEDSDIKAQLKDFLKENYL